MLKVNWNIDLSGSNYNVLLKHSLFTGKKLVFVNKNRVVNSKLFDTNSELVFSLGEEKVSILIVEENLKYSYCLKLSGNASIVPQNINPSLPLPNWAYIFILLCLLIPILTPEGLVPQLTGVLGAIRCATISKKADKTQKQRVKSCLILVTILWCFILIFSYSLDKFVALFY